MFSFSPYYHTWLTLTCPNVAGFFDISTTEYCPDPATSPETENLGLAYSSEKTAITLTLNHTELHHITLNQEIYF